MIPISEKSRGGPLVDWVPEGHDRNYTEPAAMSIRIAATRSAWLTLMFACHKRAGRLEERDGKLYAAPSTDTVQRAAV